MAPQVSSFQESQGRRNRGDDPLRYEIEGVYKAFAETTASSLQTLLNKLEALY